MQRESIFFGLIKLSDFVTIIIVPWIQMYDLPRVSNCAFSNKPERGLEVYLPRILQNLYRCILSSVFFL